RGNRAVIGHLTLDAFGNQLVVGQDVILEVAVFRVGPRLTPRLHRTERTHAAVRLELLSVDEDQLAGRLVTARQKRAEHDGVSTGCDCLGDVTRIGNAAVGDDRNACLTRDRCDVVDSGELWYANTGYDARRTYRARSYATLHRVGTCGDERLRGRRRGDVAADDVDRDGALEPRHHLENRSGMTVRGVDDEEVNAGVDKRHGPLVGVLAHAHCGADDEAPLAVLRGQRIFLALGEVLDGDQPAQSAGVIDQRELLHLVALQQGERVVSADTHGRRHEGGRGHDIANESIMVGLEADVAVGDDADQDSVGVRDRDTRDPVTAHQRVGRRDVVVRSARDRLGDHAGLGPLHDVYLCGLVLDRKVAMQDTDTTVARHRDRHPRLGHRVHRAGDERMTDHERPG